MVEPYGGKRVPLDERFFVGGDFTVIASSVLFENITHQLFVSKESVALYV